MRVQRILDWLPYTKINVILKDIKMNMSNNSGFMQNFRCMMVKGKGNGRFIGLFQHCGHSAYCVLTLNKFPHSSPEPPRIIQMRETSTSEDGNYYQWILLADP